IADEHPRILSAELPAGLRHAVPELGVEQREIGAPQRGPEVGVRAPRRGVGREVHARAAGEAGQERRVVAETPGVSDVVAELAEVTGGRLGEGERLLTVDPRLVRRADRGHALALAPVVEAVPEILEARADLELVVEAVHDLAVDAGR